MRRVTTISSLVSLLALAAIVVVAPHETSAQETETPAPQPPACTPIRALPFTISESGRFCLASDLNLYPRPTDGPRLHAPVGLRVLRDDVTIDLAGHTLDDHTHGIATNALAIEGMNRKRLVVENGTVRGFFIGVAIVGDHNEDVTVQNVRFEKVRYASVSLNQVTGYVVRHNTLERMGHGNAWYTPHAILVSGSGVIAGNLITDVIPNTHEPPRTDTEAVSVKGGKARIEHNMIVNTALPEGDSYGIRVLKGASATLVDNTVKNFRFPITGDVHEAAPAAPPSESPANP